MIQRPPPSLDRAAITGHASARAVALRGNAPLVLLVGTFMAVLDFFIVNVAIPELQRDLHATTAEIEFVVAGFALAYGSGLIIGSRLGDIFGRKRMFLAGLAVFTLSSTACGMAPSAGFLVAGRVAQGLSAALLSPQVLAILGTVLTGEAKARALTVYGVTMGLASVFAQVIGGLLIHLDLFGWGWRLCFLINLPIGIVAIVLVSRLVPESRAPERPELDLAGMALVTLALVAMILPLIEGREQGWPIWAWICLAAAAPLFAWFAVYEHRLRVHGGLPLIDMRLFRERAFAVGLLAQVTFYTSMAGFYLVFALYVQDGRGLDALGAGLIFVANGAGYIATSTCAGRVTTKIGPQVIALGGVLRIVGLGLLLATAFTIGTGGHLAWLIPGLVINGAGTGFAVAPLASTVLSRVPPQHVGATSGVLTTGIQVGNAIGVAIIGVIFYGVLSPGEPDSYGHAFGFSLAYLIGASLLLVALVQLLPRRGGHPGGTSATSLPAPSEVSVNTVSRA